jgi:site-specific recombinase XerD
VLPVRSSSNGDLTAPLAAVTARDAQAYRAYLLAHERDRSTVKRALTSLRLFFSMLDDGSGEHPSNPFDAISYVPRPPRAG